LGADGQIKEQETPAEALLDAERVADNDGHVIVTGSLYLVGDVLRHIEEANESASVGIERPDM
jgi:folylpolyglutamate synthase/dihydropteroate synthase